VRTQVEEWREERENEVLANSFACFLPVSAQPFSAAKSLNRAVSALSAGCQVISVGYPLYDVLGDLIYRDSSAFLVDLRRGKMRHSATSVAAFELAMEMSASAEQEAERIEGFLRQLEPPSAADNRPIALVHGHATSGAAHKTVRALHGLSIASPYCAAEFSFDVIFRPADDDLVMMISQQAVKRALAEIRQSLVPFRHVSERKLWIIPDCHESAGSHGIQETQWHSRPPAFQIATYETTMARIAQQVEHAFGPCRVIISESSTIPLSAEV
jgi:hypothetical protein